jgi:hypothetical protein
MNFKTGEEGPKHDPYGYTEYSCTVDDQLITLHIGLAEWLQVGAGSKKFHENENHFADGIVAEFKRITGLDPYGEEERDNNPQCSQHPDAEVLGVSGMPGETFAQCSVCKAILNSYFNEAAII